MCVCALLLLLRGVGWLDDEDALDKKQEGGRIQELGSRSASVSCALTMVLLDAQRTASIHG